MNAVKIEKEKDTAYNNISLDFILNNNKNEKRTELAA